MLGGLIKAVAGPVLSTVGGLISGGKAASANAQQAAAFRDAATYGRDQAAFQPFGMTTGFGTSQFQTDPNTGRVTSAGYTLDPRLAGIQGNISNLMAGYDPNQVGQAAQPLYGGASSLFNLGQQYLATSPEEAAQQYMAQQQGLLQPGRAADFARLSAANYGRGTGGLGVNTGTGGGPSNPLAQALFNSQAQQDARLAAQADEYGMQRARFGAGLFGTGSELLGQVPALTSAGYNPLRTQLGLFSDIEKLGMTPYEMSIGLGKTISDAGARQGEIVMGGERAAAPSSVAYGSYSPLGSAVSSFGSTFRPGGGGSQAMSWFDNVMTRQSNQASPDFVGPRY
jgi:hypothetical protein